jgi:putative MATE family efflux protein
MEQEQTETGGSGSTRTHGRDLTTGSIPRHLVAFSMPMLAGSALQTAYSFINAIWVGKFLGTDALAAVTVSFPVFFVLISVGAGLTVASNILISQYYGAKNHDGVRKVVDSSTVVVGIVSVLLLAAGEVLAPHILAAMNTPSNVFGLSVHYMRVFLLALPFGFGLFLSRNMMQGIGDSKTPLYFLTGSVIVNTVLDPLLMFGLAGLPRLGLNGTAWASCVAQAGAFLALMCYLRRTRNPVSPTWEHLRVDWPTSWATVRIGTPVAVQQSFVSIGMVVVTGIVNGFGETATAAFGAAGRIDSLAFMPAMTFSMAIATLSGQNIGAGRYDRIRDIFAWGASLSGGVTVLVSILVVTLPSTLLRIFIDDPEVIRLGVGYLHIVGSCYLFFAIMFVTNGIINGSGRTLVTTVISLCSLWVVRVPLALYLTKAMASVTGVWISMSASFATSMLISGAYYLGGWWKRPLAGAGPAVTTPVAAFAEEVAEA